MKKLILSLLIVFSAMAYSQGTIPIPSIIGLPAALVGKVDKVTGKSLIADTLSTKIQPHVTNTANPHSVTKAQVGLGNVDNTSDVNKPISSATQTALNGKQPTGTYSTDIHANITALNAVQGVNHGDQTDITGNAGTATKLQTSRIINGVAFDGTQNITVNAVDATSRVAASLLGAANGVATLDANGIILTTQLPSYIDDVLEYTNLAAFPGMGETGKIYVAKDTNKTYRWAGSVYVYITSGAVDSVNGLTGVVSLSKSDIGLSNVDNTSDANKPVSTAMQSALNGKQASGTYSTDIHSNITALNDVLGSNHGDETLTSIKTKLGAASSTNAGYLTNTDWTRFDGKQPAGAYLTGITSGQVTTALGYTPWWSSNHPTTLIGYGITDTPWTSYLPLSGGTMSNTNVVSNLNSEFSDKAASIRPISGFNANSITGGGIISNYSDIGSWVNAPSGMSYGSIIQFQSARSNRNELSFQFAIDGSEFSFRNFDLTTYSPWKKIYHSGNLTNALLNNSIPKWNGSKFINSLFSDDGGNYSFISSGSLYSILSFRNSINSSLHNDANRIILDNSNLMFDNFNGNYVFRTTSSYIERMTIFNNGNVGLGYSTDQSYKLAINGSTLVNGYLSSSYVRTNSNTVLQSFNSGFANNQIRWDLEKEGTETGGNAGSYLRLYRYADDGTFLGHCLTIERLSGNFIFKSKIVVEGTEQSDMDGTAINSGSISTYGGISAVKDINSGANINAYGDLVAYGTVRVAGGTPTQLMTRDGGYIESSSVGGLGDSYTCTQSNISNISSSSVTVAFYTKVGSVYNISISGFITASSTGTCTVRLPMPTTITSSVVPMCYASINFTTPLGWSATAGSNYIDLSINATSASSLAFHTNVTYK